MYFDRARCIYDCGSSEAMGRVRVYTVYVYVYAHVGSHNGS